MGKFGHEPGTDSGRTTHLSSTARHMELFLLTRGTTRLEPVPSSIYIFPAITAAASFGTSAVIGLMRS